MPKESHIIFDWGTTSPSPNALEIWNEYSVVLQLVRAVEPDAPQVVAAHSLGPRVLLYLERQLTIGDALSMADSMKRPNFDVQPILRDASDVVVLQILSSLGVQLRIDVHVFSSGMPWLADLLTDQILQPGPRQPVAPLGHLVAQTFEDSCQIAAWDLGHNDWHVDLRTQCLPVNPEDWHVPDLQSIHVPHLAELRSCAFCEGLLWCNGYLLLDNESNHKPSCQEAFATFVKLLNLQRQANNSSANGPKPH